jgi:abortive infection Abi-like protein
LAAISSLATPTKHDKGISIQLPEADVESDPSFAVEARNEVARVAHTVHLPAKLCTPKMAPKELTMRQPEEHKLDNESVAVFKAIFQGARKEPKGVDSLKYRASNPKHRKILDQLVSDRLLVLEGARRYRPTLVGLHYLSLARARGAKDLLNRCQRVFSSLKTHYRKSQDDRLELGELSRRTNLSLAHLAECLAYLRDETWLGGRSANLQQAEDYVIPTEHVLNYDSFQDALGEVVRFNWTSTRPVPSTATFSDLFQSQVTKAVRRLANPLTTELWTKALSRCQEDPSGAITAARSLLESTCKLILDEQGVKYTPSAKLPELFSKLATGLDLSPTQQSEESFRKITGGCKTIVDGLAAIRNDLGDSHGKGLRATPPAPRHAELAVNLAGAVSMFLVETNEARRKP